MNLSSQESGAQAKNDAPRPKQSSAATRVDYDAVARGVDLAAVAARYVSLKKNGREHIGLCPFHTERTPSFSVWRGRDGKARFHCYGCGAGGDALDFVMKMEGVRIWDAAKLLGGDSFTPSRSYESGPAPEPVDLYAGFEPVDPPDDALELFQVGMETPRILNVKRTDGGAQVWGSFAPSLVHPYRDAAGKLLGFVLRRDFDVAGKPGKETPTIQYVCTPDGELCWARMAFKELRALYGLDRLAANSEAQAIVHEGEKSADEGDRIFQGRHLDLVNITWPGGANAHGKADWSPLKDRSALFLPDADEAGFKAVLGYARKDGKWVPGGAELALNAGAAPVAMINVMDQSTDGFVPTKKGWDIADAAEAGWDADRVLAWVRAASTPSQIRHTG